MSNHTLRSLGAKAFYQHALAKVNGHRYQGRQLSRGPGKILELATFIELVNRYVNGPVSIDAELVQASARGAAHFDIAFKGKIPEGRTLYTLRLFHVSLNDALRAGVQPEQIRMFRRVFGLTPTGHYGISDAEFFQPDIGLI